MMFLLLREIYSVAWDNCCVNQILRSLTEGQVVNRVCAPQTEILQGEIKI